MEFVIYCEIWIFKKKIQSVYFWNYYVIMCSLSNYIKNYFILFIVSAKYATFKVTRSKKEKRKQLSIFERAT
jgi:hypothetical protein